MSDAPLPRPSWRAVAAAALVVVLSAGAVQAQSLRLPNAGSTNAAAALTAAPVLREADHVTAVVNSEPITASEVRTRAASVERQLRTQGETVPPRDALLREVLELLIVERTQLQLAADTGIKVEEAALDIAERSVAEQNQMDLDTFRRRLAQEGIDRTRFREQLKRDITLQRLREREVEATLRVTDRDIDDYLQSQAAPSATGPEEVNLGHVLVALPDNAKPDDVASRLGRAMRAAERISAGEDIAAVARELSDGPERQQGGSMGMRPLDRLPELFVEATRKLPVGGVAGPVRSGAGFHVLKVLERKTPKSGGDATITQTRARHILLRTGRQMNQQNAVDQVGAERRQIATRQAKCRAPARTPSQDASAKSGGDLGWANPGMFVPEFEEAMNALPINGVSEPVVSRFGVHLIQVLERREAALGPRERRDAARPKVREQMMERAYADWARELRAKAYVELREPPK